MRIFGRIVALAPLLFLPLAAASAQDALTQRDATGPVTVIATLLAPTAGTPVRVQLVLDTHAVALDAIDLERVVRLQTPDGARIAPTAVEQATGGGHHRAAVLVFPPVVDVGRIRLIVTDVGGVPERVFAWQAPDRR
jgi:hypothetical protein